MSAQKPLWTSEQAVLCGIVQFTEVPQIRHPPPPKKKKKKMSLCEPHEQSHSILRILRSWDFKLGMQIVQCLRYTYIPIVLLM